MVDGGRDTGLMQKIQCILIDPALQIDLNRFDLFHAHLFRPHGHPGLGLLFHAAEYPARSPDFAVNLGYCQTNSTLAYTDVRMDRRNIIYYEVSQPGHP